MEKMKSSVLIVDDDVDYLEASEATLSAAGYAVTTARSADEGITLAREIRPNLVILDLMLEHTDAGFALAHQIRSTPELADIPLIMVTSAAREAGYRFDLSSEEERRWIKVDRILNKPVTGAELLANVAEALDKPEA
jgi:CheY-like chemotaxis protein